MPSFLEPRWRGVHQLSRLTAVQRDWLLDEGSLTARLKQLSQGEFRVQVLAQRWQRARRSEAQILGIAPRSACLIREVILSGKNQPWIYARSVMPATSLTGHLYRLRRLKNSSLGELLFRDHSLSRSRFELSRFATQHAHIPAQLEDNTPLIGRRCRFELSGKSLLVSEIFLPTLWRTVSPQVTP